MTFPGFWAFHSAHAQHWSAAASGFGGLDSHVWSAGIRDGWQLRPSDTFRWNQVVAAGLELC
jgi:hypothetical protein